jgi:N-acetylmuramoyl-L-alanine amidase
MAAGLTAVGVALAIAVASSMALAGPTVTITDARIGTHEQKTRVVFELSDRVTYRVFTLSNPDRVVIDLPEVAWKSGPPRIPDGNSLLRKFRHGLFKPGTSRLVMDLSAPIRVDEAHMMEPNGSDGYRLVIDLVGAKTTKLVIGTKPDTFANNIREALFAPTPRRPQGPVGILFAPPPARPRPSQNTRIIVIDPGHGGVDPGARSVSGIYEKHITLKVAREVRDQLRRKGGYKVALTRDRDKFIRLRDRIAIARAAGADLFVSIHADTMPNKSVRGASVYTLSENASDAEAAALAEQENKADLIAGVDLTRETPDVANILIDLAQRETMNRSVQFAGLMVGELSRETRLLPNSHRFAGFAVLKAADVPAVLVELGFLSNPQDESELMQKSHRKRLAAAITRSIDAYFNRVQEARLH